MDSNTIIQIIVALVVGLGAGITIRIKKRIKKKKMVVKGKGDTKVATGTTGDVIQTNQGSVAKTQYFYFGTHYNVTVALNTPVPSPEMDKVKESYAKVAQKRNAPSSVIKQVEHIVEINPGTFGTLLRQIPYVSGLIAEATGSEENEVARQIVELADLDDYVQVVEGWECTGCHHKNPADARFCSNCGKPRNPGLKDRTEL